MNNEKLEDLKVMSTCSVVLSLIATLIFIANEIDSLRNGGPSAWFLILVAAIATVVSFTVLKITSSILKKRQGGSYFSTKMYIEAFFEGIFPALLGTCSAELRKLNVSEKNKNTKLWKDLCVGYDKERIFSTLSWFLLFSACVWLVGDYIFSSTESELLYIVAYSIISLILLIILICVAAGIKKDPTPIFEYMDITKVKFNTLAKHYDNAEKITKGVWTDYEYVFVKARGKAYCFSMKEYTEMTINLGRFPFVMILTSTYDCIIQSAFLPFGFFKLKKIFEDNKEHDN